MKGPPPITHHDLAFAKKSSVQHGLALMGSSAGGSAGAGTRRDQVMILAWDNRESDVAVHRRTQGASIQRKFGGDREVIRGGQVRARSAPIPSPILPYSMQSLSQKHAGYPYAGVVMAAIHARMGRLSPRVTAGDMESVAWLAYHRYMERQIGDIGEEGHSRMLYVSVSRAMIDEVRRLDPLGRTFRARACRLHEVRDELAEALGRDPSIEEISKKAGVRKTIAKRALDVASAEASEAHLVADAFLPAVDRADPNDILNAIGVAPLLRSELAKLPPLAQSVVRLNVMEGLTTAEVARTLGETEYKVSQARELALRRLRASEAVRELVPGR